VKRNSRNEQIASSRAAVVLEGTRDGADERSASSRSPSRQRLTQIEQRRSLTPAASAAAASDHPSEHTRRAINTRLAGHVLAF